MYSVLQSRHTAKIFVFFRGMLSHRRFHGFSEDKFGNDRQPPVHALHAFDRGRVQPCFCGKRLLQRLAKNVGNGIIAVESFYAVFSVAINRLSRSHRDHSVGIHRLFRLLGSSIIRLFFSDCKESATFFLSSPFNL